MNKLVKTVDKADLCSQFAACLNGILLLTDRELEVLSALIRLEMNYVKIPGESKNIINTENRKLISNECKITKDNLSRYLKKFKDKGILITTKIEDELIVNPVLIPELIKDRVQISIILRINENKNNV